MAKWKSDGKNLWPVNDAAKEECAKQGVKAFKVISNPDQPNQGVLIEEKYINPQIKK